MVVGTMMIVEGRCAVGASSGASAKLIWEQAFADAHGRQKLVLSKVRAVLSEFRAFCRVEIARDTAGDGMDPLRSRHDGRDGWCVWMHVCVWRRHRGQLRLGRHGRRRAK